MKLNYKTRRRLSLLILAVGLPLYVVLAVSLMNKVSRLPLALELLAYVVLGIAWALPLRFVFRGIGRQDPDE